MADYYFNQKEAKTQLRRFFKKQKANLSSFGSTVNQTFEASVFAKVIQWYRENGYDIKIINPIVNGKSIFRLKFSTRGAPKKYSYAEITLGKRTIQLRHQLRVSTSSHRPNQQNNANICCDIVLMEDNDLSDFSTDQAIPNDWLISFGEVKHMSAFAELVASFIGLVHELTPGRLKKIRVNGYQSDDIAPFLYASGILYPTAKGILHTIKRRKYDIDVYSVKAPLLEEDEEEDLS